MSDDLRADQLAPTVPDGATEVDATVADVATAPSSDVDEPLPTRVGRYEIAAEVGAGAMGVVYRARDPELDRVLAIKVIRARRGDTRARLLREAQAMAKVRHPNVVPIFDVGTLDEDGDGDRGGGIFVVMPLVAGGTLRAWMRKGPHPWREVVSRFVAAGRGLAAAHAAGLVHRDFKPDNVLVADDGEILVADFGLALAQEATADGELDSARSIETSSIAGTPAYMAPEQRAGGALDARSDQFSFCIAFWEGLFGERPGDARTRTIARSPLGKRSALRADGDAPAWLRAALERGLSADPAKRWPTIGALLDHLRARQQRPRRVAIAAAIAIPAIAAVTFAVVTREPAVDPCAGAGEPVAKVWTPARRAAISTALRAIDAPYAASVAQYVDDQFEKAARSFTAARLEACTATNVRGEQSPQLLDARIACLDQRLVDLQALAARLEHPDRKALNRAAQAVDGIDDLSECNDAIRLSAMPPLPAEPVALANIRDIEHRVAEVAAESALAPTSKELLAKSAAVLVDARATGRCPLTTQALLFHGRLLSGAAQNVEDMVAARGVLRDASVMADSCGADQNRAGSLQALAETADAVGASAEEQAAAWDAAAAAMERLHNPSLRVFLLLMRADADIARQDIPGAAVLAQEALDAIGEVDEAQRPAVLARIASIFAARGALDRAAEADERAYKEMRRRYGAEHPEPAKVAQKLAEIRANRGDALGAIALLEEVLRVQRGAYGPDHRQVLITSVNLAMLRASAGQPDAARVELERVVPLVEKVFGPTHPLLASAYDGLLMCNRNDPPRAVEYGRRAVALMVAANGADSPYVALRLANLGEALISAGSYAEAVSEFRHALAIYEKQQGPNAKDASLVRINLGRALLGTKDARGAVTVLEQARASVAMAGDPANVAETNLALADAHLALGDRKAADADIAAILAAFPDAKDPKHAAALAWQAKHPR
ncbi:MAG: serine/threonine-protein kinase [Deltaproteobacteria bacterium]|nr:serine/threonine-protein kinase [Deltaproteobacteria bacterium]